MGKIVIKKQKDGELGADIDEVVKEIKHAVDIANEDFPLPITSVELILKTMATGTVGAGLSIPAVGLDGEFKGSLTHVMETSIVFRPKPKGLDRRSGNKEPPDFSDSIHFIKDAIAKARSGIPELEFESATAQIDFNVSVEGTIGFFFKVKYEANATNTMILTFGEKGKLLTPKGPTPGPPHFD